MSEEGDFQASLARLRPLLSRDNETAGIFSDACNECNHKVNWNVEIPNPRELSIEGFMPFYLGDALGMVERRNDGYHNKTFQLFGEKSKQIIELRHAINRVKEIFSPGTKEHEAAEIIRGVLEPVIAAARPFQKTQKREEGEKDCQVIGYRCGMIAREFGEWKRHEFYKHDVFVGNAIIELQVEDMRYLLERNGLLEHSGSSCGNSNGLDFSIIFRDGSVHSFNWKKPGSRNFDYDVDHKFIDAAKKVSFANPDVTDADIKEVEEKLTRLVLELEQTHPPLVSAWLEQENRKGHNQLQ